MPGGSHENMRAWDPEEDQTIIELLETFGPKWSKIVQSLPGRSVSSVRNRWQRIEKGRKLRQNGLASKNRCQQCGEPKRGHVCMARLRNRGETGESADQAMTLWSEQSRLSNKAFCPAVSRSSSLNDGFPSVGNQPSMLSVGVLPPAVLPRVASPREALEDEDPLVAPEDASIPLLSSMKSGARICNELGFEALVAASQLVQREQERETGLSCLESIAEQPVVSVGNSSSSIDLPQLGRLPSYSSFTATSDSCATDGTYADLSKGPMEPSIARAGSVGSVSSEGAALVKEDNDARNGQTGDRSSTKMIEGMRRRTSVDLNRFSETSDMNSSSGVSSQDGGEWTTAT